MRSGSDLPEAVLVMGLSVPIATGNGWNSTVWKSVTFAVPLPITLWQIASPLEGSTIHPTASSIESVGMFTVSAIREAPSTSVAVVCAE